MTTSAIEVHSLRKSYGKKVVLDNVDLHDELQPELGTLRMKLRRAYHAWVLLPSDERPRGFSGSAVVPESIWIPSIPPKLAPNETRVFDFEEPGWAGWQRSGGAWGWGEMGTLLSCGLPRRARVRYLFVSLATG